MTGACPKPSTGDVRCVLLLPWSRGAADRSAPASAPRDLLAALERRGLRPRSIAGPYAALAEICLCRRERPGVPIALIVVEPSRSIPGEMTERLMGALARQVDGVTVWRYDTEPEPRLGAFDQARRTPEPRIEAPTPEITVRPASPPRLRLAPESLDAALLHAPSPAPLAAPSAMLSDEELAMLLARDDAPEAGAS